jgi:superfamily II DNA or RNA helicase
VAGSCSVGTIESLLSMHSFYQLISTFSEDNHTRGKQFEVLCKWILETDPLYVNKLDKVWLWDDWPGKWGPDNGIDLIAQDTEGKIWAIQAKCKKPKYYITKGDINSFIAESSVPKIDVRLLIATTDLIGPNAKRTIERVNTLIPFQQLLLTQLHKKQIDWPKSLGDLSSGGIAKKYTPKPYQQTAIDEVVTKLDSRGQLIMACGTGKTLTALWIDEALNTNTTLVLLPSLLLLSKTLSEWLTHSKERFAFLPVCSDESIGSGLDTIGFLTSELSLPVTTDSAEIAAFLKKPQKKVIFSTYQSSAKIAEAFKSANLLPIDLVIADEAHRCAGKASSHYALLLDDTNIPSSKRLFMTATPKIFQAHFMKKAGESGVDVASMDDEALFGPVLHRLTFGEAIENDLLTDYRVVVVGVDHHFYKDMIDERRLVETDTDIQSDAQSLASHIGLTKAMKDYDLRRIITFHSRVKAAKDFAINLPEVIEWMPPASRPSGEVIASHVAGDMPTSKRNQSLQALGDVKENQRYVLANARCLSEGVDVPALDGVAFIDPRQSEIDIVQAVGRAIRLSDGKELGTIVIPVFLSESDDADEVLNSSPFKAVWGVVNALRSHDEQLGEELDHLRKQLGKRGTVGKPDKIIFDLPARIGQSFEKALETRLLETTTASWEFWFGLLAAYKEERTHCAVPADYKVDTFALGRWVIKQRSHDNNGTLSLARKERLQEIGFIWDARLNLWEIGYSCLVSYKKVKRDTNVPAKFDYEGTALGRWVNTQRAKKRVGELPPDKVKRLDDLGFIWDANLQAWETGFNFLNKYKNEERDCNVPDKHISHGFALGSWVGTQRRNTSLDQEKISRLNNIGFIWKPLDIKWELGFNYLVAYREKNEHCLVPADFKIDGFNLGVWVGSQRTKKDQLSPDKLDRLNGQEFIWHVLSEKWDEGFKYLVEYKKKHGYLTIRQKELFNGFRLGDWASRQRDKQNQLSPERRKKLDILGFSWNPHDERWEMGFKHLVAYEKEHPNLSVPVAYKAGEFRLGAWVNQQRTHKKTGKLKLDRVKRLDSLGFIWSVR